MTIKILLSISFFCSLISMIISLRKSYKWYKKYLVDLFEYNKGRGYLQTWQDDLHKFYSHLTWAVVFFCVCIIIYFNIL